MLDLPWTAVIVVLVLRQRRRCRTLRVFDLCHPVSGVVRERRRDDLIGPRRPRQVGHYHNLLVLTDIVERVLAPLFGNALSCWRRLLLSGQSIQRVKFKRFVDRERAAHRLRPLSLIPDIVVDE